ncbi:MAG: NAD(P)/FAD-dependent oxidoreductase [Patescibacteria group bacterium]
MISTTPRTNIVIIGGGFAGIEAARLLAKKGLSLSITLVSKNTCFQYYPSLYRLVVGATVNQVSIPLSRIFSKGVTVVIDTYKGLDTEKKTVQLESGRELPYDYVVMALGSEPNYFGINGMEAHSMSFLSIDKAIALRKHFSDTIAASKMLAPEAAKQQLRTIIVGAGPSGVELAGALRPFLAGLARNAGVNPGLITVDLLDSGPRILPAIPERASKLVTDQLKKQGVTIYSNYGVNACEEGCVIAADKSQSGDAASDVHMHAGTVVWTAGTKISSAFATIPGATFTDRKRVEVTETLTLPSDDTLYVIGDGSGTPYSGLAQTAIDQGAYVAGAIESRIKGQAVVAYVPKPGVFVIPVGKGWAILNKKEFVVSGMAAWLIRILVDAKYFMSITSFWYLFKMIKRDK